MLGGFGDQRVTPRPQRPLLFLISALRRLSVFLPTLLWKRRERLLVLIEGSAITSAGESVTRTSAVVIGILFLLYMLLVCIGSRQIGRGDARLD